MKKFRKIIATAVATAGLAALMAPAAQAHITFGQMPGGVPDAICGNGPFDVVQRVQGGASYEVSDGGAITSWSTYAAAGAGQVLELKVLRPAGNGYTVVAHDGPRPLTPGVINTFKVNIPVKGGELIALNDVNAEMVNNACAFVAGEELNDRLTSFVGNAADGGPLGLEGETQGMLRLNVSATLLQKPELNIFHPVSLGPITGGGSVTLEGNHFEEVSAVAFGVVPAAKFTVTDEHHISVIAPPGNTLGDMTASVTTPAGTAVYPTGFSYTGCQVPKLLGKKLSAAKGAIKASGCGLGKVKKVHGPRGKRGKVLKQSPKPGMVLAPGSKVSIKLGR